MSIRPHTRLGLLALLIAFAPMPACRTPQAQQVSTAGMRVDVLRVRQKGGRVVVSLRIWNDHDEPVSFDYGNIRLVFQGREASAQPPRRPTEIQARGNEELVWIFECGSDLPGKSSYDIEIRDFLLSGVPSGQSAVFQIRT